MRRGDFRGPVSGLVLMQDLQAAIIFARTRLTDNSPFGDYCPAEVYFACRSTAQCVALALIFLTNSAD
jgi:hypothetical protein